MSKKFNFDNATEILSKSTVIITSSSVILALIAWGYLLYFNKDTGKETPKSKSESIDNKKFQKTSDTIDIDGYRLIVSKIIKNNER